MAVILMGVWARVVAITATYFLILGGFVDVWYREPWYSVYIGLYSMLVGAFMFPLLWPFEPLRCLVYPFQVYWLAAVVLCLITFPLWFAPPTCLGALCCVLAASFYLAAVVKGEHGQSPEQLRHGEVRPQARERAD